MSLNRVQKLLFSEYCDFEDMVLIESPFAQTTKDGKGIRQVHIGLTPTKLVLATDVLPPAAATVLDVVSQVTYHPGIDPDIETFELIAIYPVECVNLSVYRRRRRQALKARFCNNRVLYFELGGFERRKMFWNLWCEKVKFLSPEDIGSSHSETSVATSTTASTLYILDKKFVINNGIKQLWCRFGTSVNPSSTQCHLSGRTSKIRANRPTTPVTAIVKGNTASDLLLRTWTDKYLYMGKSFADLPDEHRPIMYSPTIEEFICCQQYESDKKKCQLVRKKSAEGAMVTQNLKIGDSVQINRFGRGIQEGCNTGLYLTVDDYISPQRLSRIMIANNIGDGDFWRECPNRQSLPNQQICSMATSIQYRDKYFEDLAEAAVRLWEMHHESRCQLNRQRHKRRYGLMPSAHFLNGLGPWIAIPGCQFSLQIKRAVSLVCIQKQPSDTRLRLPISKRQLVSSISCELVQSANVRQEIFNAVKTSSMKSAVILFWTPEYWYRPKTPKETYDQLHKHLKLLNRTQFGYASSKKNKRRQFSIWPLNFGDRNNNNDDDDDDDDSDISITETCPNTTRKLPRKSAKTRKRKSLYQNLFGRKPVDVSDIESLNGPKRKRNETSLNYLKRVLQWDETVNAWDFDSTTLAEQLTMIDKELFLRINAVELEIVLRKKNSRSSPNITAIVAFSHRISCLLATEIVRDNSEKTRARLMARFINVADKCHRMSNFQSCKTVLTGLQSPAVFRLRKTWAYVRKKHATKYQLYECLCRLYKDPRQLSYQKAFFVVSQNRPSLPYIGDIFCRLFDRLPDYSVVSRSGKIKSHISLSSFHSCKSNVISTPGGGHGDGYIPNKNLFSKLLKVFTSTESRSTTDQKNAITLTAKDKTKKSRHSSNSTGGSTRSKRNRKILCDYYKELECDEERRKEVLKTVVEFLEKCQLNAMAYTYNINELARSYLLKARYCEERDNFYSSFHVENANSTANVHISVNNNNNMYCMATSNNKKIYS